MDARAADTLIRSLTTAGLALGVFAVAAFEAVDKGEVDATFGGAAALILGVYFGAHVSQNGSAIRAARDQQMTDQLLHARPAQPNGDQEAGG